VLGLLNSGGPPDPYSVPCGLLSWIPLSLTCLRRGVGVRGMSPGSGFFFFGLSFFAGESKLIFLGGEFLTYAVANCF